MNLDNTSFNLNNQSLEVPFHKNSKKKFAITKENLIEIVMKNQQREFAEEIDLLENSYGIFNYIHSLFNL